MEVGFGVSFRIDYLWPGYILQPGRWGAINFFVGPNGSGKTLFAEHVKDQSVKHGFKPRYLSAERLAGFERMRYSGFNYSEIEQGLNLGQLDTYKRQGEMYGLAADAVRILHEKPEVRIKLEATLGQLLFREVRLVEQGGFLAAKLRKINGGQEYWLKQEECHGLKELIALLTFVYDDEYDLIFIDEPELHLHPQLQAFFVQELRKIAGDPRTQPGKKCFFLITHSPFIVDVQTLEDLKYCVVFHPDRPPGSVQSLEGEDETRLKRLLPKFNAHLKQFLFSPRPIFVEGHSDQQVLTLIEWRRGRSLEASGSCVTDVGGKDELDTFFRLCQQLQLDAQFIADLDALLCGKLRQSVSKDDRCKHYMQAEGLDIDVMKAIGHIEQLADKCVRELRKKLANVPQKDGFLRHLDESLTETHENPDESKRAYRERLVFLQALGVNKSHVIGLLSGEARGDANLVVGKLTKIFEGFRRSGVHVLPYGQLENYLPSYTGNPFVVPDAQKPILLEKERDFLLAESTTENDIKDSYGDLISFLDSAVPTAKVSIEGNLNRLLGDFIHEIQSAVIRGRIKDKDSMLTFIRERRAEYLRLLEVQEFRLSESGFACILKLKPAIDPLQRQFSFDSSTVAAKWELPTSSE